MAFLLLLALLGQTLVVTAHLICLEARSLEPAVDPICHFAPKIYTAAEEAALKELNATLDTAKDKIEFTVTRMSAAVVYNYAKDTATGERAGTKLEDPEADHKDVTISLGEGLYDTGAETANILPPVPYAEEVICRLRSILDQQREGGQTPSESSILPSQTPIAGADARPVQSPRKRDAVTPMRTVSATECAKQPNHIVGSLKTFDVAGNREQGIDLALSSLALLLVPVPPYPGFYETAPNTDKTTTEATTERVLHVPGDDGTLVVQQMGDNGLGKNFERQEDAEATRKAMENVDWAKMNCGNCISIGAARRKVRRSGTQRRGVGPSICCDTLNLSWNGATESSSGQFLYQNVGPQPELINGLDPNAIYESDPLKESPFLGDMTASHPIGEAALSPAGKWVSLPLRTAKDAGSVQVVLNRENVVAIEWNPASLRVSNPYDSSYYKTHYQETDHYRFMSQFREQDRILYEMENLFKLGNNPISDALHIHLDGNGWTYSSDSTTWPTSAAEVDALVLGRHSTTYLKNLIEYQSYVQQEGLNVLRRLQYIPEDRALPNQDLWRCKTVITWTPPGNDLAALRGLDPRGLHVSIGGFTIELSRTEGLVVFNELKSARSGISRLPVVKGRAYLIKNRDFSKLKPGGWGFGDDYRGKATPHAEFGPAIREKGRLVMRHHFWMEDPPAIAAG